MLLPKINEYCQNVGLVCFGSDVRGRSQPLLGRGNYDNLLADIKVGERVSVIGRKRTLLGSGYDSIMLNIKQSDQSSTMLKSEPQQMFGSKRSRQKKDCAQHRGIK